MRHAGVGRPSLWLRALRQATLCGPSLPQPSLSGLPGSRGAGVAGAPAGVPFAGALFSPGLYPAARAQPLDPAEPAGAAKPALWGGLENGAGVWTEPIRRGPGGEGGAAHLESNAAGSLPPAPGGQWRRTQRRWAAVGERPRPLPLFGARAGPGLSRQVPGRAWAAPCRGTTGLAWAA